MHLSRPRRQGPEARRRSWSEKEAAATENEPIVQNSTLLDLPSELRLQILREILSNHLIHISIVKADEGAQFGWPQGRVKATKPKIRSQWCSRKCRVRKSESWGVTTSHQITFLGRWAIQVLLVCRQIYREGLEVMYSGNIFEFGDLLTFGDFTAQFKFATNHIRFLRARHRVPTLGYYSHNEPPPGLRIAVKLSRDGPAMFLFFVARTMTQLRRMDLSFINIVLSAEYEAEYTRRHAEWVRYLGQLAEKIGQPDFVRVVRLSWDARRSSGEE